MKYLVSFLIVFMLIRLFSCSTENTDCEKHFAYVDSKYSVTIKDSTTFYIIYSRIDSTMFATQIAENVFNMFSVNDTIEYINKEYFIVDKFVDNDTCYFLISSQQHNKVVKDVKFLLYKNTAINDTASICF